MTVTLIYPDGDPVTVSLTLIGDTFDDTPATEPVIDLDDLETIGGE